jgi:hypothetical protein
MSWSGDEPGYGRAVHLPRNWSIGVTRSKDDHTQVLFSIEFGQYVTDKQKMSRTSRGPVLQVLAVVCPRPQ